MKKRTSVILTLLLITTVMQVSAFEFCKDGTIGEENLRLISIDDMLNSNSKEWLWQTSQEIEIEARVENKNDESGTYIIKAIFMDEDEEIEIADNIEDLKEEFSLSANERKSISLKFNIDKNTDKNNYQVYIKFYKEGSEDKECVENSEEEIEIEKIELCEDGNVNEDDLEIESIIDDRESNDIAWEWTPGNNIEISVDLKNKAYSEREFTIELIILDENNEEIVLADDASNLKETIILDEDEDDNINFYFTLKTNIEEKKYTLYAKAYDIDNEEICTSLKAEDKSSPIIINVEREERNTIPLKVEGPKNIETGEEASYTVTIANLGSKDEDKVSILMYNYQLKVKEIIEINNLNSGEEEEVIFKFTVPENASLRYKLLFSTEFEYNEKSDYYRDKSDEDEEIEYPINITKKIKIKKPLTENETIKKINETIEINETVIKETIENETQEPITTTIIGNVIGNSEKRYSLWTTIIGSISLAAIGTFLFYKKPKKHKYQNTEGHPPISRRYTAKLD